VGGTERRIIATAVCQFAGVAESGAALRHFCAFASLFWSAWVAAASGGELYSNAR